MSGGLGFKIETMWAFLAIHEDGDEGVISAQIGATHMPLVAADPARLADLRPLAANIARTTGVKIKLVRFTRRTEIETINP